jgi:hypothetical protein
MAGKVMNDKTPSLHGDGEGLPSYLHGRVESSAAAGQKVIEDYGLDRSSVALGESTRGRELAGDPTDLGHSLSGIHTNDHGADRRARSDTTKTPTNIKYGR